MKWDETDCCDSGTQWAISKRSCDAMRSDEMIKRHGIWFKIMALLLRSTRGYPVTYGHSLRSALWALSVSELKLPPRLARELSGTTCSCRIARLLGFVIMWMSYRSTALHSGFELAAFLSGGLKCLTWLLLTWRDVFGCALGAWMCLVFLVTVRVCQDNFGAPTTRVRRLEFFGQPASSMDMKETRRHGEIRCMARPLPQCCYATDVLSLPKWCQWCTWCLLPSSLKLLFVCLGRTGNQSRDDDRLAAIRFQSRSSRKPSFAFVTKYQEFSTT